MNLKYNLIIGLTLIACNPNPTSNIANKEGTGMIKNDSLLKSNADEAPLLKGVLILQADSAFMNQASFFVLNQDKSIFAKIETTEDSEPSSANLEGRILAYYPEYYIINFDVNAISDSLYSVKIGDGIKFVKKGKYMEYISWPEYVLRNLATTTSSNPLRVEPKESSLELKELNYKELSFKCLEISGDWVRVECNKECEGCVDGKIISGWIRWKEGNKVILKQHYVC